MMIGKIQPQNPGAIEMPGMKAGQGSGDPFSKVLTEAIDRVENYRRDAEQSVERFLSGQDEDVHKVALATQQAEMGFEMFLQAKNKVVQAYQEIMRMQI
jgi:flagellar hook-basal body complex protein FliE